MIDILPRFSEVISPLDANSLENLNMIDKSINSDINNMVVKLKSFNDTEKQISIDEFYAKQEMILQLSPLVTSYLNVEYIPKNKQINIDFSDFINFANSFDLIKKQFDLDEKSNWGFPKYVSFYFKKYLRDNFGQPIYNINASGEVKSEVMMQFYNNYKIFLSACRIFYNKFEKLKPGIFNYACMLLVLGQININSLITKNDRSELIKKYKKANKYLRKYTSIYKRKRNSTVEIENDNENLEVIIPIENMNTFDVIHGNENIGTLMDSVPIPAEILEESKDTNGRIFTADELTEALNNGIETGGKGTDVDFLKDIVSSNDADLSLMNNTYHVNDNNSIVLKNQLIEATNNLNNTISKISDSQDQTRYIMEFMYKTTGAMTSLMNHVFDKNTKTLIEINENNKDLLLEIANRNQDTIMQLNRENITNINSNFDKFLQHNSYHQNVSMNNSHQLANKLIDTIGMMSHALIPDTKQSILQLGANENLAQKLNLEIQTADETVIKDLDMLNNFVTTILSESNSSKIIAFSKRWQNYFDQSKTNIANLVSEFKNKMDNFALEKTKSLTSKFEEEKKDQTETNRKAMENYLNTIGHRLKGSSNFFSKSLRDLSSLYSIKEYSSWFDDFFKIYENFFIKTENDLKDWNMEKLTLNEEIKKNNIIQERLKKELEESKRELTILKDTSSKIFSENTKLLDSVKEMDIVKTKSDNDLNKKQKLLTDSLELNKNVEQENKVMIGKIETLEKQVTLFEESIRNGTKVKSELDNEIEGFKKILFTNKQELEKSEKNIMDKINEIDNLKKKILELDEQIGVLKKNSENFKTDLDSMTKKRNNYFNFVDVGNDSDFQEKLSNLITYKKNLELTLTSKKTIIVEKDDLINRMNLQITTLEKKVRVLDDTLVQEKNNKSQEINTLQTMLYAAAGGNDDERKKHKNLIEQLKIQLNELAEKISREKQDLLEQIVNLGMEKQDLLEKINRLELEKQGWGLEKQEFENKNLRLNTDNSSLTQKLSLLEKKTKDLELEKSISHNKLTMCLNKINAIGLIINNFFKEGKKLSYNDHGSNMDETEFNEMIESGFIKTITDSFNTLLESNQRANDNNEKLFAMLEKFGKKKDK